MKEASPAPVPEGSRIVAPADALEQDLARLYDRYAPSLLRYALMVTRSRESGRDALQEVFLRYFIARGEGRQIPVPKAWLFRVMRNYLLDLKKASRARSEVPVEQIFETGDHAPDPEMRYCQAELWRRLIRMLAPRELECLRLRGEGLCHGEIAEALSIRPGTVGVLLARSQRKIRKEMERAACGRIVGRVAAPDPYAP